MDIIASASVGSTSQGFGLVLAPFTFSVPILSLLVLLTLIIFVPISIIGTLAHLAGLRRGSNGQGSGRLIKPIASRFLLYVLYHVAMFGIWFLLASMLIGNLYLSGTEHIYTSNSVPVSGRAEIALNNRAAIPTGTEMADNDAASPTDNTGITNYESNQLRAPVPFPTTEDRIVPNEYPSRYPPNENRILPALRAYPEPLSDNLYPPYDPIYTKSDILGATYLLILIYPLLFVTYVVLWAVASIGFMYYVRKSQGKQPFKPTIMQYTRLAVWNAVIFGLVAVAIHQLALY